MNQRDKRKCYLYNDPDLFIASLLFLLDVNKNAVKNAFFVMIILRIHIKTGRTKKFFFRAKYKYVQL